MTGIAFPATIKHKASLLTLIPFCSSCQSLSGLHKTTVQADFALGLWKAKPFGYFAVETWTNAFRSRQQRVCAMGGPTARSSRGASDIELDRRKEPSRAEREQPCQEGTTRFACATKTSLSLTWRRISGKGIQPCMKGAHHAGLD